MSVRRIAQEQPEKFEFNAENMIWAEELIKKYPVGKERSAVIPLLWRAQEQNDGWTSEPAMRKVADLLGMAYIRVYEVATFYTMFQLSPVGKKAHVQVCGTTPCMLRGSKELIEICKKRISKTPHTVSEDGDFSWEEVECLGACVNAPMIQIFKDTYEDLDEKSLEELLDAFAKGEQPKPGPQIERTLSCPESGLTTLTDVPDYVPLNLSSSASDVAEAPVSQEEAPGEILTAVSTVATEEKTTEKNEASSKENSSADKSSEDLKSAAATALSEKSSEGKTADDTVSDEDRPEYLDGPRDGNGDDLKMIKGVGPKLEATLNALGFYHFDQIASWTRENIAWVDNSLSFKGRIDREGWLEQAKKLASGEETEFSKRANYDDAPKNDTPKGDK
ncbi:MAG: NADH-quinone oxidoreductase subunit NuoE [Hyphomicrobiales bacterium]